MAVIEIKSITNDLLIDLQSDYEKLKSYWFEQKEFDRNNFKHKAIIIEINYEPDEIYSRLEKCWSAVIFNTEKATETVYYFRNFINLVEEFDKNGYKFTNI
jgi:hypothetical protein